MKQRVILIAVCTLLCIAGFSQNYKSAIVGTWKCIKVDDSGIQDKTKQILDTATTDATKLAAAMIGMGVEFVKSSFENAVYTFDKKGGFSATRTTILGDAYAEKGSYKLKGDILEVTVAGEGETESKTYRIVQLTDTKLLLETQDIVLLITFEKQ